MRKSTRALIALTAAVSFTAAACGSDDVPPTDDNVIVDDSVVDDSVVDDSVVDEPDEIVDDTTQDEGTTTEP